MGYEHELNISTIPISGHLSSPIFIIIWRFLLSPYPKIWKYGFSRNLGASRSRCALRRGSDSHWSGLQNSAQLSSTLRLAQPEGSSIPSASYRLVWQVGYCKQILYKLPKIRSRVGSNPGYGEPSYVGYQSEWGDYHTAGAEKWLYHQCCLVGTAITASCENQPILSWFWVTSWARSA